MDTLRLDKYAIVLMTLSCILMLQGGRAAAAQNSDRNAGSSQEVPDTTMKLLGGKEGTLFESLNIEGEDRIRIEFERPELILNLDPKSARGLEWQSVHSVLDQYGVSLTEPFLNRSAGMRRQCFARPWLDEFSSDGVARFRPELKGVDKWRLMIADSKGEKVAVFAGQGKPPKEIVWDGRSTDGKLAPPGLTYSYVLEAYDRAGNKRNFLGEAFELPPYSVDTAEGRAILFSGRELSESQDQIYGRKAAPAAVILDVANLVNQQGNLNSPVKIEVTARSFEAANRLAGDIAASLKPYLLGNVLRIQPVAKVQRDAPARGTVVVLLPRS